MYYFICSSASWPSSSFLCLLVSHHPDHNVGEGGDPQGGAGEGQHEVLVPARRGAVGDREVEQQAQRPGQQPLQPVAPASCNTQAG